MATTLLFDVFLSHSSKDKAVVRPLAERLRADGLHVWYDEWIIQPGDNIPAKLEEGLENSRVLILFISTNSSGSDWAQMEAGSFRFRDPLNRMRRFIPLRLDDHPLKGSLAQFRFINWQAPDRAREYDLLLNACRAQDEQIAEVAGRGSDRPSPLAGSDEGPVVAVDDYVRRRRDALENVCSEFEGIHALFFKVCIDYHTLAGHLHSGIRTTDDVRNKYYAWGSEMGRRFHELHLLEGRLKVVGLQQAVLLMQQYRLQAVEVNDMIRLEEPGLLPDQVNAVTEELFRRKDRLYDKLAEAFRFAGEKS